MLIGIYRVAQLGEDNVEEDEDHPPAPTPQVEPLRIDQERDALRQQIRDAILAPLRTYYYSI